MMAPWIVHMLYAYFSCLVMRRLAQRGISNFVGIHDCCYLPKRVGSNGQVCDGDQVLCEVIDGAAAEWYQGLGPVYDRLLSYVEGNEEFEALFKGAKQRWRERARASYVPKFLSKRE